MQPRETEFGARLVSVSEAAARAGVSRQAVHQWIAQRRLAPIPTDDGHRIAAAELDRFLAERRAASSVGIRVATLRHWDEAAETA